MSKQTELESTEKSNVVRGNYLLSSQIQQKFIEKTKTDSSWRCTIKDKRLPYKLQQKFLLGVGKKFTSTAKSTAKANETANDCIYPFRELTRLTWYQLENKEAQRQQSLYFLQYI